MSTKISLFSFILFFVALKGDFMGLVERIRQLSDQQKISIAELERHLGFSNSSIRKWDDRNPGVDKLNAVADYFDVSTDYLLGRSDIKKPINKDEDPVEAMLKTVMSSDGKPLTENDRNILRGIIEAYLKNKE